LQLNAELNLERREILHSLRAQVEEDLTFLTPSTKAGNPPISCRALAARILQND